MASINLIPKEKRYVSAWAILLLTILAMGLIFYFGQLIAIKSQELNALKSQLIYLNNDHKGERELAELTDLSLQVSRLNSLKQEYSLRDKPHWRHIYQLWLSSQGVDNIGLLKLAIDKESIQLKFSADSLLMGGHFLKEIENSEMFYTTKVILVTQNYLGQQGYTLDVEIFFSD